MKWNKIKKNVVCCFTASTATKSNAFMYAYAYAYVYDTVLPLDVKRVSTFWKHKKRQENTHWLLRNLSDEYENTRTLPQREYRLI